MEDLPKDGRMRRKEHERSSLHVDHYSRIVKFLRVLLPILALAIIVVLFSWSSMERNIEPLAQGKETPKTIGENELINPHFESHDADQQPYNITADRAYQSQEKMDLIHLERPKADMSLKDGAWVSLKAKDGIYDQQKGLLSLHGDIELFHDDGYALNTNRLDINIEKQYAETFLPVSGQGPAGTLEAQGMKAYGNKGAIIFKGPAKARIYRSLDLPGR